MIKRKEVLKFDRHDTGFEKTLSYMAQTSPINIPAIFEG
jgi:hypothetical protein